MNISGNYDMAEREVAVVKKILDGNAIPYKEVKKYENADDGDVLVVLADGREVLIEVKEEDYARFLKYGGDLGIDYISAFQFKRGVNPYDWKRQHRPAELSAFKQDIDMQSYVKWGKVYYSKSHLWLFFVMDDNGGFHYCKFFRGAGMTSKEFIDYVENNCIFTVNMKSAVQMSYGDRHHSACLFLNHRDKILDKYEVDIREYLENFPN